MPNFLITEYFVNFEDTGKEIADVPFEVDGGYIELPTRPGLGIDLDEEALANFPYQQFAERTLPRPEDES